MHGVRAAIPRTNPLANCEFATLRERLIKIGARVIEHIARIRVQLPTSCPEGALFRAVAFGLLLSGPWAAAPRQAADRGKSTPDALHSESPHNDPTDRIAGARPLIRCAKTRYVMHDYG
jgi:Transposase DDE domain group 1